MAEYLIQSETLDDIADAINAKTGGSSAMTPAQMVTAIGSISGGSGIATFTGTIELTNEDAQNITIPVNVTSYNNYRLWLIAVQTGLVTGGEVSYYDTLQIPSIFSSTSFVPKYCVNQPEPSFQIKRDDTDLSTITNIGPTSYLYGTYGINLRNILTGYAPSVSASGIQIDTANASRKFCVTGAYAKFSYKVEAW